MQVTAGGRWKPAGKMKISVIQNFWKTPVKKWRDVKTIGKEICKYLIPIKIRATLNFAPLIFAHPQISRLFNFRAPLFY